jgi:hypothetical protein
MALIGALLLVLFLLLRPMDLWPWIAGLHSLEVLAVITVVGIALERARTPRAAGRSSSPQLPWLAAFLAWAYLVSIARLGVDAGLKAAWSISLGPIFMLLVMFALRSAERLRAVVTLLLGCASLVATVAILQGSEPRQCIELHEDRSEPGVAHDVEWVPDGRSCEGAKQCEAEGAAGMDYACERAGPFGTFSTQGRVRWRGQLDDPNEVAVLIGALIPFLFMLGEGRGRATKVVMLLLLALGLWAMVLTQSRGGQLVFGTVMMTMLIRRYGKWSIVLGAVATVPLVLLSWRSGEDADSSSAERTEILSEGLQLLKANPLIGTGVAQFASENPLNMAAHNSYLLIATEVGLPGHLMWCALVWMTVKIPFTVARRPPAQLDPRLQRFAEALTASTLGLLVGVFFLSFVYKHIFFVWLGLAGALHGAVRAEHPGFTVSFTRRDLIGVATLAVASLALVRLVTMTAR